MIREQLATQATWFSIISNVALAIIKWVTGFLGNSYALIADAIESTTDVLSSILVLLGIKYANRPADENHPYGHGKAEPLVTFLVVGFMISSAIVIIYQGIQNILTPHDTPKPFTLIILGVIILWKEFSYRFMLRRGHETKSTMLMADAWHHRSDAISSVAAFIGIVIALWFGEGFEVADDWAALVAAGFILYNSYLLFRPALGEIMDEHTHDALIIDLRETAASVPGVKATEKCQIRKVGMHFYVDLHIEVDGHISVQDGHAIAHALKATLKQTFPEIADVLIHVEPHPEADHLHDR